MGDFFYKKKAIQRLLMVRRKRRAEFILSKVDTFPKMSILDVGCGPNGRSFENHVSGDLQITGIDVLDEKKVRMDHPNFKYYKQDASDLSIFAEKEFDLAVSIGMMEHICDHDLLNLIYEEINRVAQQWVIIVPWKYAWIEPHFKFPFFQLFPYGLKVLLTKAFNLHNLRAPVWDDYDYIKKHYQWLSSSDWQRIFKKSKIVLTPTLDTIAIVKSNKYINLQ